MAEHRRPRFARRVSPTATSLTDPTESAPFTPEEVARARAVVRSLATAAFANLDDDRTIDLAKYELLKGVLA